MPQKLFKFEYDQKLLSKRLLYYCICVLVSIRRLGFKELSWNHMRIIVKCRIVTLNLKESGKGRINEYWVVHYTSTRRTSILMTAEELK